MTVTAPEYLAAFDAETGDFADLLMSDRDGLWARAAQLDWAPTQPYDPDMDGREIIDVDESFVEVVDRALASKAKSSVTRDQAQAHAASDGRGPQ